jgi:putative copper resistance protein D
LQNQTLHNAEHVLYLVVGYLFFLPLLGQEPIRWRVSYPIRLLVLAVAMPVDTFTGLVLGYANRGDVVPTQARPPGAPAPVQDLHWAGAVMWIGGDAIMLAFIMIVVWMWSRDDRASFGSWLEAARTSRFEEMVAGHAAGAATVPPVRGRAGDAPRPGAAGGEIDDDEHLAAYNAYLARLNSAAPDAERPRS